VEPLLWPSVYIAQLADTESQAVHNELYLTIDKTLGNKQDYM